MDYNRGFAGGFEDKLTNVREIISQNRLHHGYIIEGSSKDFNLSFAREFALEIFKKNSDIKDESLIATKVLDNNYLDLMYVEPKTKDKGKSLAIRTEDIIELQDFIIKKPYEGSYKVAVISQAELMVTAAANKLLKTLEEPPKGTCILILTENANLLLETVRSRCVTIRVDNRLDDQDGFRGKAKELVLMVFDGDYFYKMSNLVNNVCKTKEDAISLLNSMEELYRDILIEGSTERRFTKEYIFNAVDEIEKARREVQYGNNIKYVLKKMIIKIGG